MRLDAFGPLHPARTCPGSGHESFSPWKGRGSCRKCGRPVGVDDDGRTGVHSASPSALRSGRAPPKPLKRPRLERVTELAGILAAVDGDDDLPPRRSHR